MTTAVPTCATTDRNVCNNSACASVEPPPPKKARTVAEVDATIADSDSTFESLVIPIRRRPWEKTRVDGALECAGAQLSEAWRKVFWHRPPLSEVDAQHDDPDTIRVFLNGCFDLMHVGHFNALRQAKKAFYQQGYKKVVLVAGVHSDAAILGQKGPPLCNDDERVQLVRAVKWVDELVTGLPYESMSVKLADLLRVRYICHGDDLPVVKGGGGMYSEAIDSGRFFLLKRTEGISTTHIIQRLLRQDCAGREEDEAFASEMGQLLTTVDRLAQFAEPSDPGETRKQLRDAKRVVYVDGAFDLLHVGHVRLLEKAAELGDFLLVGLHSDEAVRRNRGGQRPVLCLHERALAVLSIGVVGDVVLGAPTRITQDLLTSFNVSVVARGIRGKLSSDGSVSAVAKRGRYDLPHARGILVELDSGTDLSHRTICARFMEQRSAFEARNSVCWGKEQSYAERKSYVPER